MSKIYAALIRHGDYEQLIDTPSAYQPFALNDEGKEQARQGAQALQRFAQELNCIFDPIIHSSSLLRAWQTADIFKQEVPTFKQINQFDVLCERSVGSVANLSIKQIDDVVISDPRYAPLPKDWKSNSHFCLPFIGAESLMDAGQRVAGHLKKTMSELEAPRDQNVLKIFIAHGASIRHAMHILGALNFDDIKNLSMHHAHPVLFEIDQDNQWHKAAGEWKIRQTTDRNMD